jgi:TonB family protein
MIKGDQKKLSQEIEKSLKNKEEIEYKLLINEEGKVDKIVVVSGPGEKFSDLISSAASEWRFIPAMKQNKPVKSQYLLSIDHFENIAVNDSEYVSKADIMPEIIGGMAELQKNIKYPDKAKVNGIEGKVFVKVFIDERGNVVNTNVIKSAGPDLDGAAVNAIRKLSFKPAQAGGKPVKVVIVIPIAFKLS